MITARSPGYIPVQTDKKEEVYDESTRRQGYLIILTTVAVGALVFGIILIPGILSYTPRQKIILNSAAGVSIWEMTTSRSRVSPSSRYAVAYVWSDPDLFYRKSNWTISSTTNFVGPYAKGRGICGLALSAIASRNFLQDSVGPGGIADAVVLTDNIASEHTAYLEGFGIRVLVSNLTALYSWPKYDLDNEYNRHRHRAAFFKLRATTLKAGLAGLTEYRSVIYLDVGAYLVAAPPEPDPLQGLGTGTFEYMSISCCQNSPLSVGMNALRPQQDAFEDLMTLLKSGFSPETGWGYRGLRVGPDRWPTVDCSEAYRKREPFVVSYCKDPNTSRWDFVGAEGDKGLLFAEYAVIRKSFTRVESHEFHRILPSYTFYGKWKPWMPDNPCVNYTSKQVPLPLRHIPQYWRLYQTYSRPTMATESTRSAFGSFCVAELDKGLKSYTDCSSAHGQSI